MLERTMSPFLSTWRRLALITQQRLLAALVGACAALSAGAALADPPGRVGRVAETEGTVWMADDQRGEWVKAVRNSVLTANDRLSLPSGSRAVVQVGSATLRLDGDTELEVLQLDDRTVRLHLHGGAAALQLPLQDSAREFEIVTAEGRFLPRQRGHYRLDRRAGTSIVTVWDGSLRFESPDSQLDVREGQRADFWLERERTHYAVATMERDEFTDWVVASERRYGQLASRHVSPEMTGAHDLDRYGNWDTHPQYGAVWYPQSVASDWAPYRDGHWAWVAPWGWTWVDDAPWGFAPFHYGRWVNWRGRWCWTPGTYVARPVYAPALVAWFGGPSLSVSVNLGGRAPHVGWVALAPFEVFAPWYVASHVHVTYINVNPWRNVHGYRDHHHHHDYANRHVHGGVIVVPQTVLAERRPVRADVITPQQVAVWRGNERAPTNGVAIRVQPPAAMSPAGTTKTVGRIDTFVPPPPGKSALAGAAVPSNTVKAPGSGRDVPWVQSRAGLAPPAGAATHAASPAGMTRAAPPAGAATGAPPAGTSPAGNAVAVPRPGSIGPAPSAPAASPGGAPVRVDRGDRGEPAAAVVRPMPGGKTARGEPVDGDAAPNAPQVVAPSRGEPQRSDPRNDGRIAPPSRPMPGDVAAPRSAPSEVAVPRPQPSPAPMVRPQQRDDARPDPRPDPRQDPRRDGREGRDVRGQLRDDDGQRNVPMAVHRAPPPQVQAPARVQQFHAPQVHAPQVQHVPQQVQRAPAPIAMPQPQAVQPQVRRPQQDRDDDRGQVRRGGEGQRGPVTIQGR